MTDRSGWLEAGRRSDLPLSRSAALGGWKSGVACVKASDSRVRTCAPLAASEALGDSSLGSSAGTLIDRLLAGVGLKAVHRLHTLPPMPSTGLSIWLRRVLYQPPQARDGAIPTGGDSIQERTSLAQSPRLKCIVNLTSAPVMRNEARAFEHLQMLDDRLSRDVGTP